MDSFRDVFQHLQAAHTALADANQFILRASEHMVTATEAAITASGEHDDLRETVTRLEATVLELVNEVKALRRNGGGPPP